MKRESASQRHMRNCCGRSLRNRFGTQLRIANQPNPRKISGVMSSAFPTRASHGSVLSRSICPRLLWLVFLLAVAVPVLAQSHEDEIVANLAGGRVIVHVARDLIIFAALDHS